MKKRTKGRRKQRGFVMLVVLLLIAAMTTSAVMARNRSSAILASGGTQRMEAIVKAAQTHAINQVMANLALMDPADLADANNYDIFEDPSRTPFFGPVNYPASGPYQDATTVRVGLRKGQRTQAPAGADVRQSAGFVLELLIQVDSNYAQLPSQGRVVVGLQIPTHTPHS